MFERGQHTRIANVLLALDADLLASNGCLFGGGTAIAMKCGEYRESVDVDFLVSRVDGYRILRERLLTKGGIAAICRPGTSPKEATAIRADQYGIRTLLQVGAHQIKFEIVHEGRVQLETPGPQDRICGVYTLTPLDMAVTELLANSDRWGDDGVYSRDLVDLAMLSPSKKLLQAAIEKARGAYGETAKKDLIRAIDHLRQRRGRLDQCMAALQITSLPSAVLWKRIRDLMRRLQSL